MPGRRLVVGPSRTAGHARSSRSAAGRRVLVAARDLDVGRCARSAVEVLVRAADGQVDPALSRPTSTAPGRVREVPHGQRADGLARGSAAQVDTRRCGSRRGRDDGDPSPRRPPAPRPGRRAGSRTGQLRAACHRLDDVEVARECPVRRRRPGGRGAAGAATTGLEQVHRGRVADDHLAGAAPTSRATEGADRSGRPPPVVGVAGPDQVAPHSARHLGDGPAGGRGIAPRRCRRDTSRRPAA